VLLHGAPFFCAAICNDRPVPTSVTADSLRIERNRLIPGCSSSWARFYPCTARWSPR